MTRGRPATWQRGDTTYADRTRSAGHDTRPRHPVGQLPATGTCDPPIALIGWR